MKLLQSVVMSLVLAVSVGASADTYVIDDAEKGAHAFLQFRVKHLGYSWLWGRFDDFTGEFTYDPKKPEASTVSVDINTLSLDSNHGLRDKHLKSKDYLNFDKYTKASFKSTKYTPTGEKTAKLVGDLTLAGVTKPITIDVDVVGGGKDPWGGYRQGFEGRTVLNPADFGFKLGKLGEAGTHVEMFISIEGIKK